MKKFLLTVKEILRAEPLFIDDNDRFLVSNLRVAALNLDHNLINLLLENALTRSAFFDPIGGQLMFNAKKFIEFVDQKEYLPDSYTRFKNKIGLIDERDDFIANTRSVSLVFPYKDCVLKGGQTRDDQKRREIFYNTTLAPDEIDRLLDAKALVNARRYSPDGVSPALEFRAEDNLIVKGNNLLALASLLERYEGRVKLIYIDPPYNTGGDANIFSYNNAFNHSTWLTFMKNRLELARRLLRRDGFIVIAIDHAELFYLGVLADEIFDRNNFISIVTVQHNPKGRNQSKFFSANSEFMLVYAKHKAAAEFQSVAITDAVRATFTEQDELGRYRWEPYIRARTVWSHAARPDNWYPIYVSRDLKTISSTPQDDAHELYPRTDSGEFGWKNVRSTFDRLNLDGNFRAIPDGDKVILQHKYREQEVLKNVWVDKKYQSEFNGTNLLKGLIGKNKFSYPKSLYAVKDVVKIMSGADDIVLDFFGGSGTTAHAVLEANAEQNYHRRFILFEQLEPHIDVMLRRLKAIDASFVCCELATLNQKFVDEIMSASEPDTLNNILERILEHGYIDYRIDPDDLRAEFETFTVEERRQCLMEILDMNMLYVNASDIDDAEFAIGDEDKAFNKSFYEGRRTCE